MPLREQRKLPSPGLFTRSAFIVKRQTEASAAQLWTWGGGMACKVLEPQAQRECSPTSATALQPCPKNQRNVTCSAWHVWHRGPASTGGVCTHSAAPPPPLAPRPSAHAPPPPLTRPALPADVPLTVPQPLFPLPLPLSLSPPQAGAIQPHGVHCPQADDRAPSRHAPRLRFMLQPV